MNSYNPHRDEFNFIPPNQPDEPKALAVLPSNIPEKFWCRNPDTTIPAFSECCFNHYVGLPVKELETKMHPLYDYEESLEDDLSIHKHMWIKKATGLGITEFFLRYILWLVTTNKSFRNCQIGIITGPRIDLAIKLIERLKVLVRQLGFTSQDKQTVLELNSCVIEAFPSNHMSAFRGLTNPKFILLDEADFFPPGEQQEARDASERYIAKSDPYIVMVSTPNNPGGMFDKIESDASSRYHKVKLHYTVGLGKIYDPEKIEEAKGFSGFEREYGLRYGYGTGNVFLHEKIEAAIRQYEFDIPTIHSCAVSIGVDPGFGSSRFGIVVLALINDMIHVLEAEEHTRPEFDVMIDRVFDLKVKYQAAKVYIDESDPAFVNGLKLAINENTDYVNVKALANRDKVKLSDRMDIVPVNFRTDGRKMLTMLQSFMSKEGIKIHPRFDSLISQCRTAKEINGKLDKSVIENDVFDALQLACVMYYVGA